MLVELCCVQRCVAVRCSELGLPRRPRGSRIATACCMYLCTCLEISRHVQVLILTGSAHALFVCGEQLARLPQCSVQYAQLISLAR